MPRCPFQLRGVLAVALRRAHRPLQLALHPAARHRAPVRAAIDRCRAAHGRQAAAAARLRLRRHWQVASRHGLAIQPGRRLPAALRRAGGRRPPAGGVAGRVLPAYRRRTRYARLRLLLRRGRSQLAALLLHRERRHRRRPLRVPAAAVARRQPGQPAGPGHALLELRAAPAGLRPRRRPLPRPPRRGGRAVLPLPAADLAAYPAGGKQALDRQQRPEQPLRRLGDRNRRPLRPAPRLAGASRPGRRHAGDLHQRQRLRPLRGRAADGGAGALSERRAAATSPMPGTAATASPSSPAGRG